VTSETYPERATPKYFFFSEWEEYREGEFGPAREYATEVFKKYVETHWRKRIAKKILRDPFGRRGRIFKEHLHIHLDLLALELTKKFSDALSYPGLSEMVSSLMTVEPIVE
jgi:hypothetical protein